MCRVKAQGEVISKIRGLGTQIGHNAPVSGDHLAFSRVSQSKPKPHFRSIELIFFCRNKFSPFLDKEIVKILEILLLFSSVKSTNFSKFFCVKFGQIFNTEISNEKKKKTLGTSRGLNLAFSMVYWSRPKTQSKEYPAFFRTPQYKHKTPSKNS